MHLICSRGTEVGLQRKASSFLHSQLIGCSASQLIDTNTFPSLETHFELHTRNHQASFTKHHNDKLLSYCVWVVLCFFFCFVFFLKLCIHPCVSQRHFTQHTCNLKQVLCWTMHPGQHFFQLSPCGHP